MNADKENILEVIDTQWLTHPCTAGLRYKLRKLSDDHRNSTAAMLQVGDSAAAGVHAGQSIAYGAILKLITP